jgi:hypothetical protein
VPEGPGFAASMPVQLEVKKVDVTNAVANSRILTVEPRFTVDDTVASTVGRLPGGVASSGVTLADQCGVFFFTTGNISSFVVTGRGGTPVEPGGWSPSVDLVDGSAMTSDQKRKDMGAR